MGLLRTTIMAAAVAAFGAASGHAQETTIKIGTMGWEDLKPISLITQKFLEQEGFTVELTDFSEWGIAYAALASGDVDILTSQINYVASDYWSRNRNRLEKISVVSHGLRQGLVVPSYMPIDSIEQLNEVADQVGGKIIGIEPGSGLMREADDALGAYDLDFTIVEGSTAAMTAQLQSSLQRNEPLVTMLWEPSWMVQKYDVKFLDDPQGVFAPPQTYYWIGRKGFSAENSRAREVIASVFVPIDDITVINAAMNDGKSVEEAVDEWWATNADLVERWSVMAAE